jgi:putative ABC transport system substrate-binding protein
LLPRSKRAAYLWNPDTAEGWGGYAVAHGAAQKVGFVLDELRVTNTEDLQRAIRSFERAHPQALYVNIDPRIATYRQIIADAALRSKIPSISGYRAFAEAGGLMSFGASLSELYGAQPGTSIAYSGEPALPTFRSSSRRGSISSSI